MLEIHHKKNMPTHHYYALMLFSVSAETPGIVNFYVDQGKQEKTYPIGKKM